MATLDQIPEQYRATAERIPPHLLKAATPLDAAARAIDHERLTKSGCASGLSALDAQPYFQMAADVLQGRTQPREAAVAAAEKALGAGQPTEPAAATGTRVVQRVTPAGRQVVQFTTPDGRVSYRTEPAATKRSTSPVTPSTTNASGFSAEPGLLLKAAGSDLVVVPDPLAEADHLERVGYAIYDMPVRRAYLDKAAELRKSAG